MARKPRNNEANTGNEAKPKRPDGMPVGKPFEKGNPGRPKGSRHKLGEDFLSALARDFGAHGEEAIAETREKDPAAYVRVVAGLLPKEMLIRKEPETELSDDELIEGIEYLKALVARERDRASEALH